MSDKPHYTNHRQRLFEKFDNNPDSLFDYELIELLLCYSNLRKDMKPVAKEMLKSPDALVNLLSEDLSRIDGVGASTSRLFRAIKELYNRIQSAELESGVAYTSASQVFNFLQYDIGYSTVEQVVVLLLNAKNVLITSKVLSHGVVDSAVLLPRQIADLVVTHKATGAILAHNHPTNDPTPSQSDIQTTIAVKEGLNTLGVELVDHVIVCKTSYRSMKELKLL